MQICFVSSRCFTATGGQEAYTRTLADNLALKNKVHGIVRYHTKKSKGFEFFESEGPKTILRKNWKIEYIQTKQSYIPFLKRLISLYTRPVFQNLALRILKEAYTPSIRQKLSEGTQVVHYVGAGWDAISHATLNVARQCDALFAVTPFVHPGSWADSPLDMAFYNQADLIFVCSEYERDILRTRGVQNPDIQITGLAPSSPFQGDGARFREKHGLGERPLLLFIGRKQQYKGYHTLRRALENIRQAVPDVCLVVAGPSSEPPYPDVPEGALLDLGELTLAEAHQQEKADALAAADIFCMPSEAEAFGIVYVEAWANKMPVIAGGAPAVRELVQDGINGYRVIDQNEDQLVEYATRLLTDSVLCRKLGEAGHALQQERYTWEAITAFHENAYQIALEKKGRKLRN